MSSGSSASAGSQAQRIWADVADALQGQVQQASDQSPSIRGADWRLAVVDSIGTTGTVTTTDGIIARRAADYLSPTVGDTIVVTASGSGNWLALGKITPTTTAGTWQALTYNGSWAAWGPPYGAPAYRINDDGTVSLSGLARAPASTTSTSTIATLPAAARPPVLVRCTCMISTGNASPLEITTGGLLQITDFNGTAVWAALEGISYRIT
ncbi:hypothetical protein ACFY7H_12900 [Streptomyces sp. NPDC012794]|uniref:hypothetical protein n=1 Tax=Streptomyces sp. NPDC012794 TaxID=3364850 RepID=UPI00369980F3